MFDSTAMINIYGLYLTGFTMIISFKILGKFILKARK